MRRTTQLYTERSSLLSLPQVTYTPGLNVYRPQTGNVELELEGADELVDATSVVWEAKPLASVLGGSQPASQVLASSSLAGVATFHRGQRRTNISIPVAWEAVKEGDILPFGACIEDI